MDSLITTLTALNAYLVHPENEGALAVHIEKYNADRDAFNRDFFRITLDRLPQDSISNLLDTLGTPESERGRYVNQKITVYQFLTELKTTSDNRLTHAIALIDEHNKTRWKAMAAWIALLSTGSVVPFWLYGFTAIEQFVTAASVVAAGGLAYSIAIALYTLYEYSPAEGSKNTWYQLFKDNFFALSNSVLVVSAWALLLTAAASNPVVSVLFVAGEFVHVVKEVVALAYIAYQNNPTIELSDTLDEKQKKVREAADFETRKNDVYLNLAAAILMTVIVAAWCFIPGGFIVPLVCMAAIGVVKATTQWAISQNEARMKEQVQTQFNALETAELNTNLLEQTVTNEPWFENNPERKRTMSLTEKTSAYPNQSLGFRARANSDPNPCPATVSTLGLFKSTQVEHEPTKNKGCEPRT